MRVSKVIRIQLLLITLALDPSSLAGNFIERSEDKHIGTPKDWQNKILKRTPSEIVYIKFLEILRRISGFIGKYFLISGHLDESICAVADYLFLFSKISFFITILAEPQWDPSRILEKPEKRDQGPYWDPQKTYKTGPGTLKNWFKGPKKPRKMGPNTLLKHQLQQWESTELYFRPFSFQIGLCNM